MLHVGGVVSSMHVHVFGAVYNCIGVLIHLSHSVRGNNHICYCVVYLVGVAPLLSLCGSDGGYM